MVRIIIGNMTFCTVKKKKTDRFYTFNGGKSLPCAAVEYRVLYNEHNTSEVRLYIVRYRAEFIAQWIIRQQKKIPQ